MTVTVLKDGRSGNTAEVDKKNRLSVLSTAVMNIVQQNLDGEVFAFPTGIINLTSANRSEVIYFKNTDIVDWVIESILGVFGASNGDGDILVDFTRNPDGGTIIDNGVDVVPANLNGGSSKALLADLKKGAEGLNITGGEEFNTLQPQASPSREFLTSSIIIAPGNSFSIAVTPPAGNTSMNITFGVTIYRSV